MTSQPCKKTITIHILSSNSWSTSNQTIKFGQLIEYNQINIFLYNYAENVSGRPVPDLFLFFEKALSEIKESAMELSFNTFR